MVQQRRYSAGSQTQVACLISVRLPSLLGLRWRASQSLRYARRRSVCVGAYRNRLCSVCVGVYRNRSVACIGLLQCCRCCISGDATMPVPGPSPASLSLGIWCYFSQPYLGSLLLGWELLNRISGLLSDKSVYILIDRVDRMANLRHACSVGPFWELVMACQRFLTFLEISI